MAVRNLAENLPELRLGDRDDPIEGFHYRVGAVTLNKPPNPTRHGVLRTDHCLKIDLILNPGAGTDEEILFGMTTRDFLMLGIGVAFVGIVIIAVVLINVMRKPAKTEGEKTSP